MVTATGKATAHERAIRVLHKVSWYPGRSLPLFPPAKFVSWLRPIHLDEGTPASPQQGTSLLPGSIHTQRGHFFLIHITEQ